MPGDFDKSLTFKTEKVGSLFVLDLLFILGILLSSIGFHTNLFYLTFSPGVSFLQINNLHLTF